MSTRQEVMAEMDSRAAAFVVLFWVVAVLGVAAGAVIGVVTGNAAVCVGGVAAGVIGGAPLLGIGWILEGQAALLERHDEEPESS